MLLRRPSIKNVTWLIYLKVEPRWEPLRDQKKFVNLLTQVGLGA